MTPLCVLMLSDYQSAGGAEIVAQTEAAGLRRAGHHVLELSADMIPGASSPPRPSEYLSRPRHPLAYLHNTIATKAVRDAVRDTAPDIIHIHNLYHLLSPAVLGVLGHDQPRRPAVVATAHDHHFICPNPGGTPHTPPEMFRLLTTRWDICGWPHSLLRAAQYGLHYRLLRRRRRIDRFIAPTTHLAGRLQTQIRLEDDYTPAVEILPNPVPLPAHVEPRDPPRTASHAEPPGPLRVAFAGRVAPEKGLAELLAIWPAGEYPAAFDVVGDGPALAACRDTAARRGLQVTFHGRLPRTETINILARAHIAAMPSRIDESDGLAAFESFATGTALLATDQPRMRTILQEGGPGFLFSEDNAASLAAALRSITAARAAGTLNTFDRAAAVRGRSEEEHIAQLLAIYRAAAVV